MREGPGATAFTAPHAGQPEPQRAVDQFFERPIVTCTQLRQLGGNVIVET
jgi:hypothetical protein